MKKTLLTIAVCLGMVTSVFAGEPVEYGIFNHVGAGVGVGLTGIDIEVGSCCTKWLQFRAGVTIMPLPTIKGISTELKNCSDWSKVQTITGYTGSQPSNLNMDASINMTNFKFIADFYPIHTSSFHISAGFFLGKERLVDITGTSDQPGAMQAINKYNEMVMAGQVPNVPAAKENCIGVTFGDTWIGPQKDGTVNGYMKINSFKPYLGIGFGRIVPKKTRLAFSCDMGVIFWGKPKVCSVDPRTGQEIDLLNDGNSDKKDVANILSKLSVYPVLNFRLTGRIF